MALLNAVCCWKFSEQFSGLYHTTTFFGFSSFGFQFSYFIASTLLYQLSSAFSLTSVPVCVCMCVCVHFPFPSVFVTQIFRNFRTNFCCSLTIIVLQAFSNFPFSFPFATQYPLSSSHFPPLTLALALSISFSLDFGISKISRNTRSHFVSGKNISSINSAQILKFSSGFSPKIFISNAFVVNYGCGKIFSAAFFQFFYHYMWFPWL